MDIEKYFASALKSGASDLHLVSGNKPAFRIKGVLEAVEDIVLEHADLETAIFSLMEENFGSNNRSGGFLETEFLIVFSMFLS